MKTRLSLMNTIYPLVGMIIFVYTLDINPDRFLGSTQV